MYRLRVEIDRLSRIGTMFSSVLLGVWTCAMLAGRVSSADDGAGLQEQRLLADGEPHSAVLQLGASYNVTCRWHGAPSGKLWWLRNGAVFAQHNKTIAAPRHRVYLEYGARPLTRSHMPHCSRSRTRSRSVVATCAPSALFLTLSPSPAAFTVHKL